ncbi:MAG TPA: hypothetical protein VFO14_08780 [Vicinamibacterales bacterium]|nr:hypothetical protein [Vicinamibacterales bacterium]
MGDRIPHVTAILGFLWLTAAGANGPKFYPDDPLWRDPETQDASSIKELPISEQYDFVENSFLGAGDETDQPALNTNTVDEVPDSSWFTNRVGRNRWTVDQIVRGPDTSSGPTGPWTVVSGKTEGLSPGFTLRDSTDSLYFVKFDPPSNPEMASGAEVISTKFFHAFGYHVPENYITSIRREELVLTQASEREDEDGHEHRMRPQDLDALLKKVSRNEDGSYRVLASKALPGTPVGRFRYHGTRPDDPNDIFPHEHRRELRGLRVFAAWLNHDDSRSINTFDTLVEEGGRKLVRHHLLDFGSTLGSGSVQAQSTRAGNEFLWERRPTLITMLTFGFYVRPWIKVDYPDIPAVGRIEAEYFQPDDWKPEYPNAAFGNARPEDRFWAARIIAAIPEQAIGAVIETARYTDPAATPYLRKILTERRRKILVAYLNGTSPVVDPSLSASGELTFGNAAEEANVATPAERYTIQWSALDNNTGVLSSVGAEQSVTERRAQAPHAVLSGSHGYIAAQVRAFHPDHPAWSQPLMVYFRRTGSGWPLVGLERNR